MEKALARKKELQVIHVSSIGDGVASHSSSECSARTIEPPGAAALDNLVLNVESESKQRL